MILDTALTLAYDLHSTHVNQDLWVLWPFKVKVDQMSTGPVSCCGQAVWPPDADDLGVFQTYS